MRRHVGTLLAATLLLSIVGPAMAADPIEPTPSTSPSPVVESSPFPAPAESSAAPASPGLPTQVERPRPAIASKDGVADPAGRWIVVYRDGTNVARTSARQARRVGFTAERTFSHALRGLTAALSGAQVRELRRDPEVLAVVPDEKIELAAQDVPNGINRIDGRLSAAAKIDGVDQRVDADVAIVDTGIATVSDLNVAGGYNCSTSNRALWRDVHGHGTHVAGTIGALDNGSGVVGVAPGVRVWAVKILDDTGSGLLSWYVCGLDWIAAQRDPADASMPRFESVNMSVAKWGQDDQACGTENDDILHAAICRLVASGVTVVAAAANDSGSAAARVPAAYNEVITVSALADMDGKPGALGGALCYSWGSYDDDDSFANFSNYGSDVDIIAPGKCIWSTVPGGYAYMSGTSMAAPHVAGAAALLKAGRPGLTPAEVKEALQYLGTLNWKVTSDPDPTHEKLLNVARVGPRGDFSIAAGPAATVAEEGGVGTIPVTISRSTTSFERIVLRVTNLPAGVTAAFSAASLFGFEGTSTTLTLTVASGVAPGIYPITVTGNEHGIVRSAVATLIVAGIAPIASPPATDAMPGRTITQRTVPARVVWAAAVDPSPIAGYELQRSVDGGPWGSTLAVGAATRLATLTQDFGHAYQYRVRAQDAQGDWSAWAPATAYTSTLVQDVAPAVTYTGSWVELRYRRASSGNLHYAVAGGASAKITFDGRAVGFVAPVGPTRGSAKIYWDGVYRSTISFAAAKAKDRVVMYSIGSATAGFHTLEIRLVGDGRVDVDAFVTFR